MDSKLYCILKLIYIFCYLKYFYIIIYKERLEKCWIVVDLIGKEMYVEDFIW